MVVVNFLVEFSDETTISVPVGISDTRSQKGHAPLGDFIKRLKEKCGIKGSVEIRNKDGSKVDLENWDPSSSSFLFALTNEEPSSTAIEYRETMRRTIRSNSTIQNNSNNATGSKAAPPAPISQNSFVKVESQNNKNGTNADGVVTLKPKNQTTAGGKVEDLSSSENNNNNNTTDDNQQEEEDDDDDDDDFDPRGGAHISAADAIHFISHGENKGSTSISKVAAEFGAIMCQELPEFSPMYPSALVDLVRRDPRMKVWLHFLDRDNKAIEKMETSVPGVDSNDFSAFLYIAKRRGHPVPTTKDELVQVAFYPVIDTLSHSCAPSAILRFRKTKEHPVLLRCVQWGGITAGEMISVVLPKVCFMDFFLLPTNRRRKFIQEQYSMKEEFECHCARCTGRLSSGQNEVEKSLTGAFFLPANTSYREQTRLTAEMKNEFDALKITVKSSAHVREPLVLSTNARRGKIPAENVQKIYNFLKKYTSGLVLPRKPQQQSEKTKETTTTTTRNADEDQEEEKKDKVEQQQQQETSATESEIKLHVNHWRLSFCRIALLAFLFPPNYKIPAIGTKHDNLPIRHPSVKLDQLIVRFALAQLEVENAVLAKHAKSAHSCLKRSYVVFRIILSCLPEQLSSQVQRDARSLKNVDWPMIEKISESF